MLTLDFWISSTKGDLILYDELCHASIRDGIQLSNAKAYKFNHNDFEDLEKLILRNPDTTIYIVTESVFQWMVIVQI
jgi:8-amino-7-oxononanoate synthase